MKARVKDTGEVVEVELCTEHTIRVPITFYESENGLKYPAFALEFENDIDWEQRRYEIAKAAMQGQLSNQYGDMLVSARDFDGVAESSVKFADALIAELKKGGNHATREH